MMRLIEDYEAKNFKLNIEGHLFAINHGLDFACFLDTRQALGAEMLMDIIKHLDDANKNDWAIYGWYGDQEFKEDHCGKIDDTTFINQAYFENDLKMDDLWMNMPCLCLRTGHSDGGRPPKVYLSVSMAPYEREYIMDPIAFTDVIMDNESSGLFPGSGACLKIKNEKYLRKVSDEYSQPFVLTFRMPQTFCVRVWEDGKAKDSWVFILPQDVDEMRERLSEMIREDREDRA